MREPTLRRADRLKWALIFALIAIAAGLLGFRGVAAGISKFMLVFGVQAFRKS